MKDIFEKYIQVTWKMHAKLFFLFLLAIVRSYYLMKLNLILTKYGEKRIIYMLWLKAKLT